MRYLNISDSCVFLASLAFFMSRDPLHARRAVYSAGSLSRVSPGTPTFFGSDIPDRPFPRVLPPATVSMRFGSVSRRRKIPRLSSTPTPSEPAFQARGRGRRGPFPYAACPAASHRSVSLFLLPPSLYAPQRESCVVTASSPWRPRSCQLPPRADTRGLRSWLTGAGGFLEVYVTFWAPGPLLLSG